MKRPLELREDSFPPPKRVKFSKNIIILYNQ